MKTRKNFKEALHTSLTVAVLLFSMLLMSNNVRADYAFLSTGSGSHNTESSAYLIQSTQDLIDLASYVNSGTNCSGLYFKLTQDLDFTNTTFTAIGNASHSFNGTFNGENKVIRNLTIPYVTSSNFVGLFGVTSSATITNLTLSHATIDGFNCVGGIVGYAISTNITNCNVINSTIGYINRAQNVGGIVGSVSNTTITRCYSLYNNISGNNNVGGISGGIQNNNGSTITDCISTSTVTANNKSGAITGITGLNGVTSNVTIHTTYYLNAPTVTSETTTGGEQKTEAEIWDIINNNSDNPFMQDIFATTANGLHGTVLKSDIDGKAITTIAEGLIPSGYTTPMPSSVTIADGGSLIDASNILSSTNVTIQRKLKVSAWNLFGLTQPTATANILNTNAGTVSGSQHDISAVKYDYSSNSWNTTTYLLKTDNLTNGEGYFVWPLATAINGSAITPTDNYIIVSQTAAHFIDAIQMSSLTNLNNTASAQTGGPTTGKWFALSNPYMSSLKASDVCGTNGTINNVQGNTVYVYDPELNGGSWTNPTYIKPGYGFMVASQSNATTLNGRITRRTTASKSAKAESIPSYITFTSQANNTTKEAFATINDNAENGFDDNDAYVLISSSNEDLVEPYFLVDNHAVMNNIFKTMPYYTPINFHASKVSNTNLTVNNIPNDVTVSIIDLSNGNETALENGSTFSFVANEGENAGRFVAKFGNKNVGIDNNAQANDISFAMYPNPATTSTTLMIDGLTNNAQVIVNDIQGREIKTYTINKQQSTLNIPTSNLASGVYYVRVVSNDLTKTEKLVVK